MANTFTYDRGYMAEFMQNGDLSTKADVYSLGVLVLEFLTRRRAVTDISLKYVERKWNEGTLADITDPRLDVDSRSRTKFFKIGLLCVQEYAEDRPVIEEVVSMLLDSLPATLSVSHVTSTRVHNSWIWCENDYDTGAVRDFISELFPR
ncbi:G-type lectin S-receptor-like serine/threonine-protein kinase At1g11300 [Bidens hawaiensis]|uniref:G-type lectin S-receptor-like serine/threonine-protein kinase At1g11300 n=1 Tax=Bidens hawaiensis TaxID=980011 RepID=UPI00404A0434